jgi:hypothetical protein
MTQPHATRRRPAAGAVRLLRLAIGRPRAAARILKVLLRRSAPAAITLRLDTDVDGAPPTLTVDITARPWP